MLFPHPSVRGKRSLAVIILLGREEQSFSRDLALQQEALPHLWWCCFVVYRHSGGPHLAQPGMAGWQDSNIQTTLLRLHLVEGVVRLALPFSAERPLWGGQAPEESHLTQPGRP